MFTYAQNSIVSNVGLNARNREHNSGNNSEGDGAQNKAMRSHFFALLRRFISSPHSPQNLSSTSHNKYPAERCVR